MNDSYKEILVKKKTTTADALKKYGLIALTAVLVAAGLVIHPALLFLAVAAGVGCYFLLPRFDLEYEYLYVNGDFDIDKIMGKQRRKRVGSYALDQLEILAPAGSHDLDPFSAKAKLADYTSGEDKKGTYTLVYNGDDGYKIVKLELDNEIISDIRRRAPRKVSREAYM